jgi:hypothetical protein
VDNSGDSLSVGDKYLRLWNGWQRRPEKVTFGVFLYPRVGVRGLGRQQILWELHLEMLTGKLAAKHFMQLFPSHEERFMAGNTEKALRQP